MTPVDRVKAIYEAFGRGDIPAILELLHEDIQWEYGLGEHDIPWLEPRRGRAQVAAFFEALRLLEFTHFAVKSVISAPGRVIALMDAEFVVRATGRRVREQDEVHIWHVNDAGELYRFRHAVDTLQHHRAYHGTP